MFGVLLLAPLTRAADAKPKREDRGLEVLVSADAIPAPEGFRPKPGKPIYYVFTQTRQSLGDTIAGVKLPPPELVEQTVVTELGRHGFLRTEVGGPMPQIILVAIVGDANFEEPPIDVHHPEEDPEFRPYLDQVSIRQVLQRNLQPLTTTTPTLEQLFSDDFQPRTLDVEQIRSDIIAEGRRNREKDSPRGQDKPRIQALVGAEKILHAIDVHALSSLEAQRFVDATHENRLYISLTAYDAARWTKKERFLLWRTTMLVDWRHDFAKELPVMLARGGPLFGTDAALPAFLDNRDERKTKIEIGELKVVPEKDAPSKPEGKK